MLTASDWFEGLEGRTACAIGWPLSRVDDKMDGTEEENAFLMFQHLRTRREIPMSLRPADLHGKYRKVRGTQ